MLTLGADHISSYSSLNGMGNSLATVERAKYFNTITEYLLDITLAVVADSLFFITLFTLQ